ncbi:MAG TPA: aldolase/citrate lyase family protein [Dehalococcoidia bacterium]|nr:aldolase/citrate lyase family protein [Dehalococcoidia bacterium]
MRPNKTKAKLRAGQVAIGYILGIPAPALVEVAGQAGLDFVVIDCEHGPMNEQTAEDMIRAAEVVDVTPLVRVPSNRPEVILRFLDRGAAGVVVPHVNTRQDAEAVVSAVKFAPEGRRGYAAGRWTIGTSGNPFEFSNRETLVICMVEEKAGVANIEEILAVPGLDVIHIGAGDLAQELGLIGQTTHPEVVATVRHLITATVARGKVAGTGGVRVTDYEGVRANLALGARFVTVSPPALLEQATRDFREQVLRTPAESAAS